MNYSDFIKSTKKEFPSDKLEGVKLALWYVVKDDWDMAHNIAQDICSESASWIHAYLHRAEGDIWNANYWYRRAEKEPCNSSLKSELDNIIKSIFNLI